MTEQERIDKEKRDKETQEQIARDAVLASTMHVITTVIMTS